MDNPCRDFMPRMSPLEELEGYFGPKYVKLDGNGDLCVHVSLDTMEARTLPDFWFEQATSVKGAYRDFLEAKSVEFGCIIFITGLL